MSDDYPTKTVAPGVQIFGPHRERFWPGNFSTQIKRFAALTEAILDKSGEDYAIAQKLVDMIGLDRPAFAKISDTVAPYWLVNMSVVELRSPGGGLLVYSPVPLDKGGRLKIALDALGPVRVVIAPHAFHTSGLSGFREAYPDALFVCPKAGFVTGGKSLSDLRPEIKFHSIVEDEASVRNDPDLAPLITEDFSVEVMNDAAINEIVLFDEPSSTLINADIVYKAVNSESVSGAGGPAQSYMGPDWFSRAYQMLNLDPSPSRLLPDNRAFLARHANFDRAGFMASLQRVLAWDVAWMIGCHTDLLAGKQARRSILESWQWLETD